MSEEHLINQPVSSDSNDAGDVVVSTTTHFHSTKPGLRLYTASNPAYIESEIRDGEIL